jgi:hypothetical protein
MTRQGPGEPHQAPVFFHDLNLDQIVEAIIAGWKEYDLAPFFYSQLNNLDAIAYRQEVMQDLEDKILMQSIKSFSGQMRAMREHLDQVKKIYYKRAMDRLFVGTVEIYCTAVERFSRDLGALDLKSRGLRAFRKFLKEYVVSAPFRNLYKWLNDGRCCGNSQEGVVGPFQRLSILDVIQLRRSAGDLSRRT